MAYRVDERPPAEAAEDLARLWRDNLPGMEDAAARARWLYEDAPGPPGDALVLTALDGADAGRAVGTAGLLARRLDVGGAPRRAALLANLAVDRGHRTLGPALALVRRARELVEARYDLAYGVPNASSAGLFRRAGFAELGPWPRYACVLRHGPYLARAARLPGLAAAAGWALDLAVAAARAPAALAARREHALTWADGPDARLDALWEAAAPAWPAAAWRGAALVRWRFFAREGPRPRLALLSRRADAAPAAYAVVDREGPVAHVRDLFGHPAALRPLLRLLVPACRRLGAASVSIRYAGDPRVVEALRRAGFRAREPGPAVVALAGRGPLPAATLAGWHLTELDQDV